MAAIAPRPISQDSIIFAVVSPLAAGVRGYGLDALQFDKRRN